MLRALPTALLHHPALTPRQRAILADAQPAELGKHELADLGALAEAIIRVTVPAWQNYFPAATWLAGGRALISCWLRSSDFDAAERARVLAEVARASPARLLALYANVAAQGRARRTARLREVAAQVSRATQAPVRLAAELIP